MAQLARLKWGNDPDRLAKRERRSEVKVVTALPASCASADWSIHCSQAESTPVMAVCGLCPNLKTLCRNHEFVLDPFWGRNNLLIVGSTWQGHLVPESPRATGEIPPSLCRTCFKPWTPPLTSDSLNLFFKSCSLAENLNKPPATRQEPPQQLQTQFNQYSLAPHSTLRSLACYYQKIPI